MDPDAPLARERPATGAQGTRRRGRARQPTAGALAGVTGAAPDGSDLAGHERRTTLGDGPGPPTHAVSLSENCAESAGASRGDHEVGAWTSMLGVDDDEDVVALLARALDETPTSGFDPRPKHDRLFEQNRRRAVSGFERARARTRTTAASRAAWCLAAPRAYRGRVPANARGAYVRRLGSIRRGGSRSVAQCADARRESLATPEGDFRDDSLVDRLRVSVGASVGAVRRAVSSPACHDGVPTTDTHPNAATGASVGGVDAYPLAAAAAAAAQSDASGSRPFGFLGVTRPPWHTRWEAHLEVSADAEPGADASESIRANPRTASLAESTRVLRAPSTPRRARARARRGETQALRPAAGVRRAQLPGRGVPPDALGEMRACDFPEFVRSLVRHAHAGERRLSRFRRARHAGREVGGQAGTRRRRRIKFQKKNPEAVFFPFSFAPRGSTRAEARTKRERSANEARPLATANRRRVVVFFKKFALHKKNRKSPPRAHVASSVVVLPPRRRTRCRSSATPTRSP